MNAPELLDCGHCNTFRLAERSKPGYCGGTGYGIDRDGKKHCYACCAEHERAVMVETGRACLYLVGYAAGGCGQGFARDRARITDWAGELSFPVRALRTSRHGGGFGAQRTDAWFVGPDGYIWHAVNRGNSQIARCRRTKERA